MLTHFGKTLLIANPTAQNGNGAAAAARAIHLLGELFDQDHFAVALTTAKGHAVELAANAGDCDVVIVLGGDGVIHEVANGLMRLPIEKRPALGVLPAGSGNDYARTLGMSFTLDEAVRQLLDAPLRLVDVGCCNGVFFVETLSFGLDAAIALDTVERRQHTGKTGTALYLESGIDQLLHHLDEMKFTGLLDGERRIEGSAFTFAVQIGPTYGGGFRICPEARLDDGLFDLCIAHPPLSVLRAMYLFLRAKDGHHTGFKQISFHRAASICLHFDERPPVQIDGEPLIADAYKIDLVPRALRAFAPR